MAEHAMLFFSGVFAGCAMTSDKPELIWQGAVVAVILYGIAWALHSDD